MTLLLIVHVRKSHVLLNKYATDNGSIIDDIPGSREFSGSVDCVINLQQLLEKELSTRRKLRTESRYRDLIPEELTIERVSGVSYRLIDEAEKLAINVEKIEPLIPYTLDLETNEKAGITYDELCKQAGISKKTLLAAIEQIPNVQKTGDGVRGKPYRFGRIPPAAITKKASVQ